MLMLEDLIDAGLGIKKCDLVVKNINLVNVSSGEIYKTDIGIKNNIIVGLGKYDGNNTIDAEDKYAVPGFIDAHVHFESSLINISQFSRVVVPHGTTAIVADPHEIANVLGLDGIKNTLEESKLNPLKVFVMISSLVPVSHLGTSGFSLESKQMRELINLDNVLGLAETDFHNILNKDQKTLEKVRMFREKLIDGHAPDLIGKELNAYLSVGIRSDHESRRKKEIVEKLRKGMKIIVREGSAARDVEDFSPLIKKYKRNFLFATDDKHLDEMLEEGHINFAVKKAVKSGVDPIVAVQCATINTAEYFRLDHKIGSISPGRCADIVIVNDLKNFYADTVIIDGKIVALKGKYTLKTKRVKYIPKTLNTVKFKPINPKDFAIKSSKLKERVKVIEIVEGKLVTNFERALLKTENGDIRSDVDKDVLKIVVIERYDKSGSIGKGFVKGFNLKSGAIGSTYSHDCHNLILVGTDNKDLAFAANKIREMRGGMIVVDKQRVLASLSLRLGGIISVEPYEKVLEDLNKLNKTVKQLGCKLSSPFATLSFLALEVIPDLKLTNKGLIDVKKFKIISLLNSVA